MEQLDVKSLYEEELKEKLVSMGEKAFKGKQLYESLGGSERKAGKRRTADQSGSGAGTDIQNRRNAEISVPSLRRSCDRECVDEI